MKKNSMKIIQQLKSFFLGEMEDSKLNEKELENLKVIAEQSGYNITFPENIMISAKAIPPYMPFKNGYGYMGILLQNTDIDKIQCHFCGAWLKSLTHSHLETHKLTAKTYKEQVGLYRGTSLMSLGTIHLYREKVGRQKNNKMKKGNTLNKDNKRDGHSEAVKASTNTAQHYNKYGTCEEQLKDRLNKAIEKYGRVPQQKEEQNLYAAFRQRFGTNKKGLEYYGHGTK